MGAIGLIEFNSIAKGIEGADRMLKAADVELVLTRAICPGKYVVLLSGEVSAVESSVDAGLEQSEQFAVDSLVLPNIHPSLLGAFGGTNFVDQTRARALGIIESFSVASIIIAADTAAKASEIELVEIRLAVGIGGKGMVLFTGDVSAVEAAVHAGASTVSKKGMLVQQVVIPSPDKALCDALL